MESNNMLSFYTSKIREFINNPRIQFYYMKNLNIWSKLRSSLDVIEDSEQAIGFYFRSDFPAEIGGRYLFLYGLFQALYIQQDAFKTLCESLEYPWEVKDNKIVSRIRNIRNDGVGHPTNRKGLFPYHFISRITIEQNSFEMFSHKINKKLVCRTIKIQPLVSKQKKEFVKLFKKIINQLQNQDRIHKEKFKRDKLEPIFSNTHYFIEKINDSIVSNSGFKFAEINLNTLLDALDKFKKKLEDRGESVTIHYPIQTIYKNLSYPINKLSNYFNFKKRRINSKAEKIFCEYIEGQFLKLQSLAKTIDEEYNTIT